MCGIRRSRSILIFAALIFAAIVAAVVGGSLLLLQREADIRRWVEDRATASLGRRLTLGQLRIAWGNPLTVELDELRLGNADWGSAPEMLSIRHLTAKIDSLALLRGRLRFASLTVNGPQLLLERDSSGRGNWKFGDDQPMAGAGPAIVPKNRTQFPTLISLVLKDGELTYRASPGKSSRLSIDSLTIHSDDDEDGVTVFLDGAYDDAPLHLHGTAESFASLRNPAAPYGTTFSISTKAGLLDFKGTMAEPLDFDGIRGALRVETPDLGALIANFGFIGDWAIPLRVAGRFEKKGDEWHLFDASGQSVNNAFHGSFSLDEGGRGERDAIAVGLDFDRLDLQPILAAARSAEGGGETPIHLPRSPAADIDARIAARAFVYNPDPIKGSHINGGDTAGAVPGRIGSMTDLAVHIVGVSGQLTLDRLAFKLGEGSIELSGEAQDKGQESRVTARLAITGMEASRLVELAGGPSDAIRGKIDGAATAELKGESWSDALKTGRGQVALSMRDGRVARSLLEKVSTDLLALFRKQEGWAPIACLAAFSDFTGGKAVIAPLRLHTSQATFSGHGRADLIANALDLTLESEGGSSVFALNIPLRITGPFDALNIRPGQSPALGEKPRNAQEIAPELRPVLEQNPCFGDKFSGTQSKERLN